ncbi:MAG TPA: cell division protein FtsZ, partial [Ramlibacter sp.]|nr:cell division protein FtsZ [Ramlibacter sp.]
MTSFTLGILLLGAFVLAALVAWNAWTTRRNTPRQPQAAAAAAMAATTPAADPLEERTEPVFDDVPLAPLPVPEKRPGLD